jgi:hypothetical protein
MRTKVKRASFDHPPVISSERRLELKKRRKRKSENQVTEPTSIQPFSHGIVKDYRGIGLDVVGLVSISVLSIEPLVVMWPDDLLSHLCFESLTLHISSSDFS